MLYYIQSEYFETKQYTVYRKCTSDRIRLKTNNVHIIDSRNEIRTNRMELEEYNEI